MSKKNEQEMLKQLESFVKKDEKAEEKLKKVEPVKVVEAKKEHPKKEILDEIGSILVEYNGMESDIPINHKYWALKNQLGAE